MRVVHGGQGDGAQLRGKPVPRRGRGAVEVSVGPVLHATESGRETAGWDLSDHGKDSYVVAYRLSAGGGSKSP